MAASLIHVNTGHASFLSAFLAPDLFWPYFKSCHPFLQLLKLVARLPPLELNESWSLDWVLDLPLPLVLTRPSTSDFPLPFIQSHYLVSDLICYNHSDESLIASRAFIRSFRRTLIRLFNGVFLPDLGNLLNMIFTLQYGTIATYSLLVLGYQLLRHTLLALQSSPDLGNGLGSLDTVP